MKRQIVFLVVVLSVAVLVACVAGSDPLSTIATPALLRQAIDASPDRVIMWFEMNVDQPKTDEFVAYMLPALGTEAKREQLERAKGALVRCDMKERAAQVQADIDALPTEEEVSVER